MTDPHTMPLYRLIVEIRRAFNELAAVSDRVTAPFELTAAERAVLEYLVNEGPATVPDIARAKSVSRQHIQKLADALVAKGLGAFRENPSHKRSQILESTKEGRTRFQALAAKEGEILLSMNSGLDAREVERAAATLRTLRDALRE